jgi:hypothetical protein
VTEVRRRRGREPDRPARPGNARRRQLRPVRLRPNQADLVGRRFVHHIRAPADAAPSSGRVAVDDHRVERLTKGKHYLSRASAAIMPDGALRVRRDCCRRHPSARRRRHRIPAGAAGRQGRCRSPPYQPDGEKWADIKLVAPQERWHEVEGRRIQGLVLRGRRQGQETGHRSCSRSTAARPRCTAGR